MVVWFVGRFFWLVFFFGSLHFFSLFWYLLWTKISITISCLGYQWFSLFIYISLYLNTAPNLSALCCLMWQGPKPQWGAGCSFDYTNGIFSVLLGRLWFFWEQYLAEEFDEITLNLTLYWQCSMGGTILDLLCDQRTEGIYVCMQVSGSWSSQGCGFLLRATKNRKKEMVSSVGTPQCLQADPDIFVTSAIVSKGKSS